MTAALFLAGCSYGPEKAGPADSPTASEVESVELEPTSLPEPNFTYGAVEIWSATAEELFGGSSVHYDMVRAFGPLLVFGSHGETKAVDPQNQTVVWEQEGVGPLTRCGADLDGGTLYCPIQWEAGSGKRALAVIDVETGKTTEMLPEGGSSEAGFVTEVEHVPGGLVIDRVNDVLKVDLAGKVIWQQGVTSQLSDSRRMTVSSSDVLIYEPGFQTLLDVGTGDVIYAEPYETAPPLDASSSSYYSHIADSERFTWDTGGVFQGKEDCVFTADDVVLFAPDNCELNSGRGTVTALDPQTGEPLWELGVHGWVAQAGNGENLTTISGLERAGSKGIYKFDSVTVYGPVGEGEPADSLLLTETSAVQGEVGTAQAGVSDRTSVPGTHHPSSDFCPSGSSPYAEGETESFYVSICRSSSGQFTYVGYSPSAGSMVLPAEDLGGHWHASNQSHGYSVSSSYLDVYELGSGGNVVHEPFLWTRQY